MKGKDNLFLIVRFFFFAKYLKHPIKTNVLIILVCDWPLNWFGPGTATRGALLVFPIHEATL